MTNDNKPLLPVEPSELFQIDTTLGSILHNFARSKLHKKDSGLRFLRTIIFSICLTYLPMLIFSIIGKRNPWEIVGKYDLPFLRDLNTAFMFIITFPVLIIFILKDDMILAQALKELQSDKIIAISSKNIERIKEWKGIFRNYNIVAQLLGLFVGVLIATINYYAYTKPDINFWITYKGDFLLSGWCFIFSIFIFYSCITIYVIRSIAFSVFFIRLVKYSELSMLPGHPDKCGGLRPIGLIGLRNQYLLSVLGINLVVFWYINLSYFQDASSIVLLMALAGFSYLVLGPIVFMAPLLPFQGKMNTAKSELLREVSQRLRVELSRIRTLIKNGSITRKDEDLIDRLRKIGSIIDELPVWPFDFNTRMKFFSAYAIPIFGALTSLSPSIREFISSLSKNL